MFDDPARAIGEGRLANLDTMLQVRSSIVTDGAATGSRAIDVRVAGGIDVRILPDRGLDLGAAWFRGWPISWVSAVGETGPHPNPHGDDWADAFGGGLMVTCGLANVGRPSEGHGLHGRFSHLRAGVTGVARHARDGEAWVEVRGEVVDAGSVGRHLRLERSVRTWAGNGRIEVDDVVANLGSDTEPSPLLYHFNFGHPLWSEGAHLEIPSETVIPRDAASETSVRTWDQPPEVTETEERVLEHMLEDGLEWGRVRIVNERLGIAVIVGWRRAELPRLHQWIHLAPGVYALGIEPANCSTSGRAHDRAEGRLPALARGERRHSKVYVETEEL